MVMVPVVTLCCWIITASEASTPIISANSLRYGLYSSLEPVHQLHPENEWSMSLWAVITNAEVPFFVIGTNDSSLTARAVLSMIDCAIAAQLSGGILYFSSKIRLLVIER